MKTKYCLFKVDIIIKNKRKNTINIPNTYN